MSSKTVLRMLDRGELPCVAFPSGRRRVSEEALERFMRNLEKKSRGKTAPIGRNFEGENGHSTCRLSAGPADENVLSVREHEGNLRANLREQHGNESESPA